MFYKEAGLKSAPYPPTTGGGGQEWGVGSPVKNENYNDFKLVATLLQNKEHLTEEGLEKIEKIKSNMNSYRVDSVNES